MFKRRFGPVAVFQSSQSKISYRTRKKFWMRFISPPGWILRLAGLQDCNPSPLERICRTIAGKPPPHRPTSPRDPDPPQRVETALTAIADGQVAERDRQLITMPPRDLLVLLADMIVEQRMREQQPLPAPDQEPIYQCAVFGKE